MGRKPALAISYGTQDWYSGFKLAVVVSLAMAVSGCTYSRLLEANGEVNNSPNEELIYPPDVPPSAKIISDFHSCRGVNGGRCDNIHQGIDIGGPSGQLIIAIADGRVLETHTEKCWGPTISIHHGIDESGKRLIVLYGHVQDILVEKGQTVSRGDVVARLGNNHHQFSCIGSVRHLHLQLGRKRRVTKGTYWGHSYFLRDGFNGVNPHPLCTVGRRALPHYFADGPYRITCFDKKRNYPSGTLTYPVPCVQQQ